MRIAFLAGVILLCALTHSRADVEFLWGVTGVAGRPSELYAINPGNGKVLGLIGKVNADNVSGLARHPATGVLYATQGQMSPQRLLRLDRNRGAASTLGTIGFAVSDTAFQPNGTLLAFGAGNMNHHLFTIDLATGTPTQIGTDVATIGSVGMSCAPDGKLYMLRVNSIVEVNPANGAEIGMPVTVSGATPNLSNMLTTNSDGVFYSARRNNTAAPTSIYRIDPLTGVTTLVGTIPDLALSGLEFGRARPPLLSVKGGKTVTTSRSKVAIRGKASSFLPLKVSAKGAKTVDVKNGRWKLRVKLTRPRTRLQILCKDGMGQRAVQRVTIKRKSPR